MTTYKRVGRAPLLVLSVVTVAIAALALMLVSMNSSNAAAVTRPAADKADSAQRAAPADTALKASRSSTADRAGDSPVQQYVDDTPARHDQLINNWDTCLIAHGAKTVEGGGPSTNPEADTTRTIVEPIPASATTPCQDKLPLSPKEQDPNLNPNYVADSEANVACLRAHGRAVHTVPDHSVDANGLGWTYDASDNTPTPDNEAEIDRSCEIAAFLN